MIKCVIRVGVLPTKAYTAPASGRVHSHTWGPPANMAGAQGRYRPERDPTKIKKLKPVFPTGVGIEMISPSPTFVLPQPCQWWNTGSEGTMLEEI